MSEIKKPIGKVIVPLADLTLSSGLRDIDGFEKQCNFLEDEGIDTVVVLGRTGGLESAVGADRHTPFYVRKNFLGNMLVCVGDSSKRNQHGYFSAKQQIMNHIDIAKMYQADGIVVPTLFYGPEDYDDCPKDHDMAEYFFDIFDKAREKKLPVLLYNNPAMTGREIPLDLVEEFAKEDIVFGIKDSSGDTAYFDLLVALNAGQGWNMQIYQGRETLASWSMRIGADGIVPSSANVLPQLFKELAANPHDEELQIISNSVGEALYRGKSEYHDTYAGLRYALGLAGILSEPENPFAKYLTNEERKLIRECVNEIKVKF